MIITSTITVITLCRDNSQELVNTLSSLPFAVEGLCLDWELLILDGSEGSECAHAAFELASRLGLPLSYFHRPARGIYAAMNDALLLAKGELVSFMHSGDRYLPGGLTALVQHWIMIASHNSPPVAVFAQAWVQPCGGGVPQWLTPPSSVRNLRRWLSVMAPCHQAFVFEKGFARAHPYSTNSLIADRLVMRAALVDAGPRAYLQEPVCVYSLSGASSALPGWRDLGSRLRDGERSNLEKCAELVKALINSFIAANYSNLMHWRAALIGWLCHW